MDWNKQHQARLCPLWTTNFFEEYEEHVKEGKCRADSCKNLLAYRIIEENCVGCTACARKCPVNYISGEKKEVHEINQDLCIKCGNCLEVCKFDAVEIV